MVSFHHAALAARPRVRRGVQARRVLLGTLALARLVLVMALMMLALSLLGLVSQAMRGWR
jgi:hypothetical protein